MTPSERTDHWTNLNPATWIPTPLKVGVGSFIVAPMGCCPHTVCEEFERVKQETEKITAASGDALRQMEHQIKVVREGLKTFIQFPVNFLYCAFFLSSCLAKLHCNRM